MNDQTESEAHHELAIPQHGYLRIKKVDFLVYEKKTIEKEPREHSLFNSIKSDPLPRLVTPSRIFSL